MKDATLMVIDSLLSGPLPWLCSGSTLRHLTKSETKPLIICLQIRKKVKRFFQKWVQTSVTAVGTVPVRLFLS